LSVEALHENETLVVVAPVALRLVGVVGATESVHLAVAATTDAWPERFPAASYASTENV
jgi:hypothetical protein